MNVNSKRSKKQADNNVPATNVLSQEEYNKRIATIIGGMKSNTWKDLETKGKFAKNDKLTFIDDDTLIVGCDIAVKSIISGQLILVDVNSAARRCLS